VQQHAPIQALDKFDLTPAHLAAFNNHQDILLKLLQHTSGAAASIPDKSGRLPIHSAAYVCSFDCITVCTRFLLACARMRCVSDWGVLLLHHCNRHCSNTRGSAISTADRLYFGALHHCPCIDLMLWKAYVRFSLSLSLSRYVAWQSGDRLSSCLGFFVCSAWLYCSKL
jgi:hypothetical protein